MKIEIQNITKHFGGTCAADHITMTIASGSFMTLLGPSGCGKTTLLRMIAGLETPEEGEILFDGKPVFSSQKKISLAPQQRGLGFVFQDFAIWPHMTVYENVAFPLRAHHIRDVDSQVQKALSIVKLEGFEKRFPAQLSGGQQQRVSFARAIVGSPSCILFDEPLSALDARLREEMRYEIRSLTRKLGVTSIFVTHDQIEAMSMSDEIAVLNNGRLLQTGSPQQIYHHPADAFTAEFVGKSNWLSDTVMCRPETVSLIPQKETHQLEGTVTEQQFVGDRYEVHADVNGRPWLIYSGVPIQTPKIQLYIRPDDETVLR